MSLSMMTSPSDAWRPLSSVTVEVGPVPLVTGVIDCAAVNKERIFYILYAESNSLKNPAISIRNIVVLGCKSLII